MTTPNPLTDRFEVDNHDQTKAQAFIDQMRQITTNPSFTAPEGNPENNNKTAGAGSAKFDNLPDQSKAKKL